MATDVGVGDAETPFLVVAPADGTTQATLTARPPSGTPVTVPVTAGALEPVPGGSDQQQRWTATTPVVYDEPGRWVLSWAVTGIGEGAEDVEVWVVASPVAGGPTWAPGRSRVANYLPHRTLVRDPLSMTEGADTYAFTWDSTTTPPGVAVDRLIADGIAWVTGRVAPLHPTKTDMAAVVVCLYCAAAIERGWPHDGNSLQRANDLEKRMDVMLADLIAASADAVDQETGQGDYALDVVPVWSFPPANPRYDYPGYW